MALLNQKAFERKLQNMSSTQDSIQTLSLWMIHHKKHADDMVTIWADQLKKATKTERRLILFYLANDVLQNSRKKGKEFSLAFTKILRDSMQLLSDKNIKPNVERVIKIWEERKLFEKAFLESLRSKLESPDVLVATVKRKETTEEIEKEVRSQQKQKRLPPADFKPSKLIDALKALRNFEGELTLKESQVNSLRIDASDLEIVRQLKDRTGGGKFCEEYELATSKLDEFSGMLRREQQERQDMIKVLEDGEAFYDTSYGEVKVIVHAYKTFGNRLTSLKKKVDAKVNKLLQKEAEKAKTGPVSAPQASFLTSGLPDVSEGSAPSTPTQVKEEQQDTEEVKPVDPTVDNTEVADMEIEDDSDSEEKSETSEEAGSETKGSNNQTPTSTESSESQQGPPTSKQVEISGVVTPVTTMEPAQTPKLTTMPQPQGSSIQPQQPLGTHQSPVGLVVSPYIGLQGVPFPAHPLQFRPGVPLVQSAPSSVRNTILQSSRHLSGPGEVTSHSLNVSQIAGKPVPMVPVAGASVVPNASAQPPGGFGMLQTIPGSTGFISGQAPLPVALASLPVSVQTQSSTALTNQQSNTLGKQSQERTDIRSPDSEASAPSPVGSPELHLDEGDETPETTPAPLGDVGINSDIGFQTNKSFLEHPLPSNLTVGSDNPSALTGYSGPSTVLPPASGSMASPGTPPLQDSSPVACNQLGEHQKQAAQPKKENGQNVSAVDILAQLLSRGRQLQQASDIAAPVQSMPVATPASVAVTVSSPLPVKEPTGAPQSKPLLSLIDSLFPKLSDSIKTLKEKERASGSQEYQDSPVTEARKSPSSGPARPLPTLQQTEPGDVQRPNQGIHTPGESISGIDMTRPSANNHNQPVTSVQGHVGASLSQHLPVERPVERPLDVHLEPSDSPSCGPLSNQDMHHPLQQVHQTGPSDVSTRTSLNHCDAPVGQHIQGPSQGHSPGFPLERPMGRSLDLPPHGVQPFGPRLGFSGPRGPHFNKAVGSTIPGRFPPFTIPGKGSSDISAQGPSPRGTIMEGPPRVVPEGSPRDQGHSPRGSFIEGPPHRLGEVPPDIPGRFPLESPLHGPGHSSRGSLPTGPSGRLGGGPPDIPRRVPLEVPPHHHSPRGPFTDGPSFRRLGEGPQDMGGRLSSEGPPPPHSPRGVVLDCPPQRHGEGPPEMPGKVLSEDPHQSLSFRGPLIAGPPRRPLGNPNALPEHHLPIEGQAAPVTGTTNPGTLAPEGRQPSDSHNEDEVSNCAPGREEGRPGIRRPFNEAGPPHNPHLSSPRLLPPPHPRDDAPQIHHGPHPGVIDDQEHRREFEHRDDIRMDQRGNHGRGPWDPPRDRPGPMSSGHPDRRGPHMSPRMPPKRVDFRDDDPSLWTSFESPGRSPVRHGEFADTMHWDGPSDVNRFHEFRPPQWRRHPFENERMRFPGPSMKRPGPPPVSFSGPPKRPFY